jgi:hypothetical protein
MDKTQDVCGSGQGRWDVGFVTFADGGALEPQPIPNAPPAAGNEDESMYPFILTARI